CRSLASVVITDSVTSIGNYAFAYCSSLVSVTIPDSVTSIGWDAFYGCSNLATVYYTGTEEQWNAISIISHNAPIWYATKVYNYAG
ncbi:MAG: leucine-rich repeat domain-containing protein, partial [Clostridia bacterium]|nr:leucine-rich repeat domain-containing protein [Clostridia bacterium]